MITKGVWPSFPPGLANAITQEECSVVKGGDGERKGRYAHGRRGSLSSFMGLNGCVASLLTGLSGW